MNGDEHPQDRDRPPAGMGGDADAAVAAAHQHHQAGRLAEAEAGYERILRAHPDHGDALHLLGVLAHQTGRHQRAAELIGRAIEHEPNNAQFLNNLGIAYMALGRTDEAVGCYRRAVEADPGSAVGHFNLANALRAQGRADQAVACYRRALDIEPDAAEVHHNLGVTLAGQGDWDGAAACYRRAIDIDPGLAQGHTGLGNAYKRQGKAHEAAACYRRAIEIRPDYPEAHYNLGNVHKSQGDLAAAAACYNRAIEINPDYAEAYNNLGNVRNDQGNSKEAIACYNRAIEIDLDYAEAYNNLGNVFKDRQDVEEAAVCYRRAAEIRPLFAAAHYNLARVHTFVPGDPGIDVLKDLLARENVSTENKTDLLFALAKAHDDIGEYAEAAGYYERANKDMAGRITYDPPAHRKRIQDIKKAFREPCAPEDPKEGEPTPIFVVGMSRSGKTLVESLLAQHADVHGAGESREWTTAMKTVLGKHGITESYPACMDSLTSAQIREVGAEYVEEVSKLSPDSPFFVDTMPGNYPYIGMIFEALPWAKVIYCRRDPLDNCLFVYFRRYMAHHGYSYDLKNIAAYCGDHQDVMAHWQGLYGDRILCVQYEEMVANPAESAERIYEYCGLAFDPAAIRADFRTDEIGHWNHYEPYLGALRQGLGLAR